MGIPPRFGIPSDTIFGADCGLVMGELRDRRKRRPRRAADGIPGPGSGVRHRRFGCRRTHRPDDGRARHPAVMWLHGQARPQAGGACRRLRGGPQHVAAGPGRHFAAIGEIGRAVMCSAGAHGFIPAQGVPGRGAPEKPQPLCPCGAACAMPGCAASALPGADPAGASPACVPIGRLERGHDGRPAPTAWPGGSKLARGPPIA
jgi:hypothetical protein